MEEETETDVSTLLHQLLEVSDKNSSRPESDLGTPFIRPSLKYVYPLFIFLQACVSIVGLGGNLAIVFVIIKRRLYKNPTFLFIGNLALSDIIKAAVVAPITLANLLIQNFIFGSFMCFFLPMMHSFPIHASIMTYTMLAADRCRYIVYPMKSRIPAGLCTIAIWVISVCVVLPYAVFIKYVDLRPFGADMGLCLVDHDRHIEEYIRAMFVIFFCLPLAVIAFLYVKVSMELKCQDDTNAMALQADETTQSVSEATYQTHINWSSVDNDAAKQDPDVGSLTSAAHHRVAPPPPRGEVEAEEEDLDMRKEKRTQKYLITMVVLFAMCWLPITILILVTHFVVESNENKGRFDITYLTFTFFGYLSTCTNPVLFASWRMSDRTKNRLRGYFQFSNRSRRESGHSALGRVSEIGIGRATVGGGGGPRVSGTTANGADKTPKSYV